MLWCEVVEKAERLGVENCEVCPLANTRECAGGMVCYGGSPIEPPCCSFEDDDDIGAYAYGQEMYREQCVERDYQEMQAKKKKQESAAKAAQTRREMQIYCSREISKLKTLEKRLRSYESLLRMVRNLSVAVNIADDVYSRENTEGKAKLANKTSETQRIITELKADIETAKARYAEKRKEFYAMRKQTKV